MQRLHSAACHYSVTKHFLLMLLALAPSLAQSEPLLVLDTKSPCVAALSLDPQWSAPLSADFTLAEKQVSELLARYGQALAMGHERIELLLNATETAENRELFNSANAPALMQVEPAALTAGHVAHAIFLRVLPTLFASSGPKSLTQHWQLFTHHFHKARRYVLVMFVSAAVFFPLQQAFGGISTPYTQQPIAEFHSAMFRLMPDFLRPDSVSDSPNEASADPDHSAYGSMFNEVWRNASERVPMNQREGRSYYYEADSILIQLETDLLLRITARPAADASDAEQERWRLSVVELRSTINAQNQLFIDAYSTAYGREHMEPRRLRLLAEADAALLQ